MEYTSSFESSRTITEEEAQEGVRARGAGRLQGHRCLPDTAGWLHIADITAGTRAV